MLVFEYVLILLAAICLSNLINRFVSVLSVPVIQIVLGALITLLPLDFRFELDPDLFFVLFVAPLVFYTSLLADKKTMWAQRGPILNVSVLLVLVTVIAVGYLVNFLIPTIPLAAAFALIASLGPTDDVAVASIGKRTNVPPKIMNILQGESTINDISGIVCFQFALAAMLTGTFSLMQATGRFFVVALGGIVVGLVFSWLKYKLVQWLRSLGMENITLHLLLGILTPFLIFLIAERLEVSGIVAIFAAGIAHSFNRDKFNPERANHNIAFESVWSMLSFTLEGLVFVILGTQLPKILASIDQGYSIAIWEIVLYILLITFLFILLRFVWSIVTINKKNYDDPEHPVGKFRASIIFSLAGARGAVTLASVMSIPILMNDGSAFPERDLIILIAGGAIVISLLITNFILPLCVRKKTKTDKSAENEAYLEILQNVIAELKEHTTPENKTATTFVISNYHARRVELQHKHKFIIVNREEERKLKITICKLEIENITGMLERGEVDQDIAQFCLDRFDNTLNRLLKKRLFRPKHKYKRTISRTKIFELMENNARFVIEKLNQMSKTDDSPVIQKVMTDYEIMVSIYQRHLSHDEANDESIATVALHGFQIERDNIQAMLETGRISRETAKEMRHNISLMELQMKKDYF